ncbi:hypothetical protein VTO73DRAFT_13935 [Trametes versicolor]
MDALFQRSCYYAPHHPHLFRLPAHLSAHPNNSCVKKYRLTSHDVDQIPGPLHRPTSRRQPHWPRQTFPSPNCYLRAALPKLPPATRKKCHIAFKPSHTRDTTFGPYKIARKPGLDVHVGHALEAHFPGLSQFTNALSLYLQLEGVPPFYADPRRLLDRAYPIYKKFSRVLPSLRGAKADTFADSVIALPAREGRAAKYSTVLYLDDSTAAENIGVKGYRVGRVRLLFALPPELQRLRVDSTDPHAHLAYVELYTPFAEKPEEYTVTSSRDTARRLIACGPPIPS